MLYKRLPTQLWQLSVSFLPSIDIIDDVALLSKYMHDQVVWNLKTSGPLLWRESALLSELWVLRGCCSTAPFNCVYILASVANVRECKASKEQSCFIYYSAIWKGNTDALRALIHCGVPLTCTSRRHEPVLSYAVECKYRECVEVLLKASEMDVNAISPFYGKTALMNAVGYKDEYVKLLLEAGANVHIKSSRGETALDIARRHGLENAVALLEQRRDHTSKNVDIVS